MLSDFSIREALANGDVKIDPPPREDRIQPASIDFTLSDEILTFSAGGRYVIDLRLDVSSKMMRDKVLPTGFTLNSREFALATTVEHISLGLNMVGRIEGKSSLGRVGLLVHTTAGFLDPGFCGQVTLEMCVLAPRPIVLYPGMPICQISLDRLSRASSGPGYQGKYQGQQGPQPSKFHENWNGEGW